MKENCCLDLLIGVAVPYRYSISIQGLDCQYKYVTGTLPKQSEDLKHLYPFPNSPNLPRREPLGKTKRKYHSTISRVEVSTI